MRFNDRKAQLAVNFFHRVLKHTGDYYGEPFILAPWEEEATRNIFGWEDDAGNRLIEIVYLEVPKKSGKTEWAAGVLLCVLSFATKPGFQVYGAAAATRQAMNVYMAACSMVKQAPVLEQQFRILGGTNRIIKRDDRSTFYAAVAADGDMGDGVNPAANVCDEVHRWKTRKQLENWDVLVNGGITRKVSSTLTVAITTAGVRSDSPLAWRLHEKTKKIEQGIVKDPKFYGKIYGADPDDPDDDPKTWVKANPSLIENGGFLPLAKIREKYETAVAEGDLRAFRRYFLNKWDQEDRRLFDMRKWDRGAGPWVALPLQKTKSGRDKVRDLHPDVLKYFAGRKCWAGIDLSMTTDFSAVSLCFPVYETETSREAFAYDVLPFVWLAVPDEGIRMRERIDGMPYSQWATDGWIELCEDGVIDHGRVKARLKWAARRFNIRGFCFDRYNSRELSTSMASEGYKCIDVPQQISHLNAPTKKIMELVAGEKFYHGAHPVTRWHASCCSSVEANDNIMLAKPERKKETARIDIMAATATALTQAILDINKRSVYAERGVLTL